MLSSLFLYNFNNIKSQPIKNMRQPNVKKQNFRLNKNSVYIDPKITLVQYRIIYIRKIEQLYPQENK